jgi:hypothetical protein
MKHLLLAALALSLGSCETYGPSGASPLKGPGLRSDTALMAAPATGQLVDTKTKTGIGRPAKAP